jgi:hypothetical protein
MARRPARPIGSISVEIEGVDLPGGRCGPDPDGDWYDNVHVGLARGRETVEQVPGDAPSARWIFDVAIKTDDAGALDFGGPYVLGPRDQRHLGLRWFRQDVDGSWVMFRGAKLRLYEMDPALFEAALRPGRRLVGRVGLTDEMGWPRCATVRPPHITWSVVSQTGPL